MNNETWEDAIPASRRQKPSRASHAPPRATGSPRALQSPQPSPKRTEPPRKQRITHVPNPDEIDTSMLTMAEVEGYIVECNLRLEELVERHFKMVDEASEAKADWLHHQSRVIVRITNSGDKMAQETKVAYAHTEKDQITGEIGNDLYRSYKNKTETAAAQARAMNALQTTINSWQSINSNLRAVAT